MNMQYVVKVNGRIHEIKEKTEVGAILNGGKQWAKADFIAKKMLHKHAVSGRFMSVKIKN